MILKANDRVKFKEEYCKRFSLGGLFSKIFNILNVVENKEFGSLMIIIQDEKTKQISVVFSNIDGSVVNESNLMIFEMAEKVYN